VEAFIARRAESGPAVSDLRDSPRYGRTPGTGAGCARQRPRRALEARNHATLELEHAAFGGLYIELVHVDHDSNGTDAGYMRVRIDAHMLIGRGNDPQDDIVERNNNSYVYLRPQGADDAAIKRQSNFPGIPSIFIPVPPH
jgi:hypothetical protein